MVIYSWPGKLISYGTFGFDKSCPTLLAFILIAIPCQCHLPPLCMQQGRDGGVLLLYSNTAWNRLVLYLATVLWCRDRIDRLNDVKARKPRLDWGEGRSKMLSSSTLKAHDYACKMLSCTYIYFHTCMFLKKSGYGRARCRILAHAASHV